MDRRGVGVGNDGTASHDVKMRRGRGMNAQLQSLSFRTQPRFFFPHLERSNDMSRSPENSHVEGCAWAIEEGGVEP